MRQGGEDAATEQQTVQVLQETDDPAAPRVILEKAPEESEVLQTEVVPAADAVPADVQPTVEVNVEKNK